MSLQDDIAALAKAKDWALPAGTAPWRDPTGRYGRPSVRRWAYFFLSAVFGCFGFLGVFAFLSISTLLDGPTGSSPAARPQA